MPLVLFDGQRNGEWFITNLYMCHLIKLQTASHDWLGTTAVMSDQKTLI